MICYDSIDMGYLVTLVQPAQPRLDHCGDGENQKEDRARDAMSKQSRPGERVHRYTMSKRSRRCARVHRYTMGKQSPPCLDHGRYGEKHEFNGAIDKGLTLLHLSPQREPFLSLTPSNVSHTKCLSLAECVDECDKGLTFLTFWLNVVTFCGIRW